MQLELCKHPLIYMLAHLRTQDQGVSAKFTVLFDVVRCEGLQTFLRHLFDLGLAVNLHRGPYELQHLQRKLLIDVAEAVSLDGGEAVTLEQPLEFIVRDLRVIHL